MANDENTGVGTLGLERWVQFTYIVGALFTFWLLDHLVKEVWDIFDEPDPTLVTAISGVGAILLMVGLYKHAKTNKFVNECAGELSKVTWPTRKETQAQTVVVLIVSAIAAAILGVFDAVWSAVTDLIYKA